MTCIPHTSYGFREFYTSYIFIRKIYKGYNETPMKGNIMFEGIDTAAKTMAVSVVTGVVVAVATNYGMKAYDRMKAKRAAKKDIITEIMEETQKN